MAKDSQHDDFAGRIGRHSNRKMWARGEKRSGLWHGLGMFGLVGWSVSVPALLLTALGIWIDSHFKGSYSWTLMLLIIGIVIGCFNAWYWIRRESENNQTKSKRGLK